MKSWVHLVSLPALLLLPTPSAFAFGDADVGKSAPAFTAKDAAGKSIDLARFRGKTVVLEWTNEGCPYVRHVYASGVMQALQRRAASEGAVWLTIISSAPGKQGYLTPDGVARWRSDTGADPADVLLDPAGELGREYGAKATPTLYVIDPKGVVQYMGAIDDHPSTHPEDAKTAKNYLALALDAVKVGRAPPEAVTTPYGCSVKY